MFGTPELGSAHKAETINEVFSQFFQFSSFPKNNFKSNQTKKGFNFELSYLFELEVIYSH